MGLAIAQFDTVRLVSIEYVANYWKVFRVAITPNELLDRAEIIGLLSEYAACLDERRFDDLPRIFTETGAIVFPGGAIRGATQLRTRTAADLERYHLTQHVVSNQLVSVNGEHATLRANAIGTHVIEPGHPSRISVAGGRYLCDLVRTPGGWRFESITPQYLWFAGEPMQH